MRYFRNHDNEIFAYDDHQIDYINLAAQTMTDITAEFARPRSQDEIDAQMTTSLSGYTKKLLNDMAISWGYLDIYDAISYRDSANTKFATEARLLSEYRDQVKIWSQTLNELITIKDLKIAEKLLPPKPQRPI